MNVFETERLRVRWWRQNDLPVLHGILSDPLTMQHWPAPLDEEAVQSWLHNALQQAREYGCARWCCERKSDGQVVGDVGIAVKTVEEGLIYDLGYIIHAPFWRQGFGLEAAAGAVQWARQNGLPELTANMAVDNLPSVAMAEALGMRRVRTFVNPANLDKQTYWYTLPLQD